MRNLKDFKALQLVEEEKSDYSKFDALVRAGLANKAQIQKIHRVLDKMGEERPNFNPSEKALMQSLFSRMADLISNNKQIFAQTKRAVREDVEVDAINPDNLNEAVMDMSNDPPFVLILKRKSIRYYPNNIKVALYHNQRLNKYFSVPYGPDVTGYIQSEGSEINTTETLDEAIQQLQNIKDSHQHGTVNHKDGTASKVDVQTAGAILAVYESLNDENKKKFGDMASKSHGHLLKAANFAYNHLK